MPKLSAATEKNPRWNVRTIGDSITDNKVIPGGGRKKFKENSIEIWV